MNISSKTRVLAVVGKPIRHSLSPKIHNYLCKKLDLDYVYTAFEPDSINEALDSVRNLDIKGINVTAPYKYGAFECVDILSESAHCAGSVNTVVNNNGILTGYSTDGDGLYYAMKHENIHIQNKRILLLGAGGAAEPICVMLFKHGANKVYILNRTVKKAAALANKLNSKLDTDIFCVSDAKEKCDLIINTTSAGMGTDDSPIADLSLFSGAETAIDIIYYPRKTRFLRQAEELGMKTMNGLGMLVGQGILSYELFAGVKVPQEMYEEVLKYIDE